MHVRLGNGHYYTPKKITDFKKMMHKRCPAFGIIHGKVLIRLIVYLETNRVRDVDNIPKVIFDALKGVNFDDDNMIHHLAITKYHKVAKADCGWTITITPFKAPPLRYVKMMDVATGVMKSALTFAPAPKPSTTRAEDNGSESDSGSGDD
jgi:Holliday junction resolvase RusA-like endonuclease